jgi:hypothetical protein
MATITLQTTTETTAAPPPLLTLQLAPPLTVTWSEDVIDNEHLNRRSSKAC